MSIQEYADVINAQINITYHPNQKGRWTAKLEGVEVVDGCMLRGEYGNGGCPAAALKNYVEQIRGKTVRLYQCRGQEALRLTVPDTLTP